MGGLTLADVGSILLAVGWLVLLEGLLSGDNALVLAVMVRHLPKKKQKRALLYGIWGAIVFRGIAVVCASYLLQFWQLKVVGGLYLLFLAIKHFVAGDGGEAAHGEAGGPEADPEAVAVSTFDRVFWVTVLNVELADIAFSIDSILAAVAITEGLPSKLQENHVLALGIIYVGGILGIVMMRFVANLFLLLLDRFKGLAAGAYLLVAWIGLKLTGSGIDNALNPRAIKGVPPPARAWLQNVPAAVRKFPWEMPDLVFWAGMIVIVVASMLYRPKAPATTTPTSPPPRD